jgi:hypothetical protein
MSCLLNLDMGQRRRRARQRLSAIIGRQTYCGLTRGRFGIEDGDPYPFSTSSFFLLIKSWHRRSNVPISSSAD